jgi:hypothetical protein
MIPSLEHRSVSVGSIMAAPGQPLYGEWTVAAIFCGRTAQVGGVLHGESR